MLELKVFQNCNSYPRAGLTTCCCTDAAAPGPAATATSVDTAPATATETPTPTTKLTTSNDNNNNNNNNNNNTTTCGAVPQYPFQLAHLACTRKGPSKGFASRVSCRELRIQNPRWLYTALAFSAVKRCGNRLDKRQSSEKT